MSNGKSGYSVVRFVTVLAVGFWLFTVIRGGFLAVNAGGPITLWVISILVTIALLALAGHEINGQWFGVLIDTQNKYSLARLQIILWTVMVMTAYLTMALPRIRAMLQATLTQAQALEITFPNELILAMGISALSFAGSSLIKSNKKSRTTVIEAKSTPHAAAVRMETAKKEFDEAEKNLQQAAQAETNRKTALDTAAAATDADKPDTPAAEARDRAMTLYESARQDKEKAAKERDAKKTALEAAEKDVTAITEAQGLLHRNADPSHASWTDLCRGEEIGNYKLVDISKVQMLFFTVVVIATYAAGITALLYDGTQLVGLKELSFPPFSDTLNALLGISHGTYLSAKTVNHS